MLKLLLFCFAFHRHLVSIQFRGYYVIHSKTADRLLERINFEDDQGHFRVCSLRGDQSSILVHPALAPIVLDLLKESDIEYVVVTKDLQKDIEDERRKNGADWFESYHTFEEILQWLKDKTMKHLKYCTLIDIGRSHLKKPLRVIKINGSPNQCKVKPSIWIDSGIHAREWITHSTGTYLIERLLEDYQRDPYVKYMRDTYDWYFLPVINPDGYEYSWTDNRMWRKSRSSNFNSSCVGADINRNFDHHWMTVGASSNPCSETFAGPHAFSESESRAVSDFIEKRKGTWNLFVTLHSHGHLWMTPWGYKDQLPEDFPKLERVGRAAVEAIKNFSGIDYHFGSSAQILYKSSGTSRDWAKGVPSIPFVYTVELRNETSFVLPPSEIIPNGIEIWRAIKASIKAMEKELPPTCKAYLKKTAPIINSKN